MKILPVSLNFNNINETFSGRKTKNRQFFDTTDMINAKSTNNIPDTFVKRDDKYAKAYSALIKKAYFEAREEDGDQTPIKSTDIKFLLDIKDYDKFKAIITTPVIIPTKNNGIKIESIFFYTDADATRQLARKLNKNGDRELLKSLLMKKTGYNNNTVFHKMAEGDNIKKTRALQDNLSVKEFKRFMKIKNYSYDTPYSLAQENNGNLEKLLRPLFAEDNR